MLEKAITYTDFNGVEQTETFYFNLSKVEMTEMQLSKEGGMAEWLQNIANSGNAGDMLGVFKDFILKSVGVKSPDGRRFVKNDEVREDFMYSPAFDSLFMELASDADAAQAFMIGIMPMDMVSDFKAEVEKNTLTEATPPTPLG